MRYPFQVFILFFVFGILVTCEKENNPPAIQSTTASPQMIKTGETSQLTCVATDPDGDQLSYSWSSSNGTFPHGTAGNSVTWKAPDEPGTNTISVIVNDGQNVADGSVNITVEANPQLYVTPTELNFGTEYMEKIIEIKNTSSGTLSWTISENLEWLTISTSSGETTNETDEIEVSVDRNTMTYGNYSGKIILTSNSGSIEIIVFVIVPGEPKLNVSASCLDFGENETELNFRISNVGTGILNWTIEENIAWLTLDKDTGGIFMNEDETIPVIINRDSLNSENYTGNITVKSDGGMQIITVKSSALIADFSASKTNIVTYESIQFIDKTINEPTSWLWNFGDGTTSIEQNPTKTYSNVGTYTITLYTGNKNGENIKTISDYIIVTESGGTRFEGEDLTYERGIKSYTWYDWVTVNSSIPVQPTQQYISTASNDSVIVVYFPKEFSGQYSVQFKGPNLSPGKYVMIVRTHMDYGGVYDIYVNDELVKTFDYYDFVSSGGLINSVIPGRIYFPDGKFNSFDMEVHNITSYNNVIIRLEYKGPGSVLHNALVIDYIEFEPVGN